MDQSRNTDDQNKTRKCSECKNVCELKAEDIYKSAKELLSEIENSNEHKNAQSSPIFRDVRFEDNLDALIESVEKFIIICENNKIFKDLEGSIRKLKRRLSEVRNRKSDFNATNNPDEQLEIAKKFKEMFYKYDRISERLEKARKLNKSIPDSVSRKENQQLINSFDKNFKDVERSIAMSAKASQLKVDMLSKITQLIRKHKEARTYMDLIDSHGHKGHYLLTKECHEFQVLAVNYCLIRMCVHAWSLNRESPNVTINRIIAVLDYAEKHNIERYKQMENFLWGSEMPFKEGKTYGRLALRFPYKDIKNLSIKDKLKFFAKTDGLDTQILQLKSVPNPKDPDALKDLVREISGKLSQRTDVHEDIWNDLSDDQRCDINKAIRFANKRNRAIFIMLFFQLHGSLRQPYLRESDRIISSTFFRYLQFKAQVMFNSASDDQRTRLAHSLEVAGIAKIIAKQMGCNWELAETISLGHDLGHVPFGHSGEDALNDCLRNAWAGRFLHSLQSVKVVGLLAHHATIHDQFGINGLCLSRPVIEGILKHDTDNLFHDIRQASWRLQYNDWRCAFNTQNDTNGTQFDDESDYTKEDREHGLALGGFESQIAYWADKIAYAGHDWDELAKSGMIEKKTREIEHIFKRMHQIRHMAHAHDGMKKSRIEVVSREIDLIRLMRYHMDNLRRSLSLDDLSPPEQADPSLLGTTPRIFEAFEVSGDVVKKDLENIDESLKDIVDNDENRSPLAQFVYELSVCIKKIDDEDFELRFFTKEEYKLVLDFFTVTHDMIFITKTYPRPYKKNDDVLWVLCRYLMEADHRCIVQALQSDLLAKSRQVLDKNIESLEESKVFDENEVRRMGRTAFIEKQDSLKFDDIAPQSLSELRKGMSERKEYKKDGKVVLPKKLKQLFRKTMQDQMQIRMSDTTTAALNRIISFIFDYYIGSDKVRVMKLKARKVI